MKQFKEKEAVQPIAPSEYDEYRREIAKFSPIKGKSRHFQFLEKKGIVRYEPYQGIETMYICAPTDYQRYDEIRDKVEKYDWAKLQEVFAEFPEEEVAWRKKLDQWLADTKKVLISINSAKKVAYTE